MSTTSEAQIAANRENAKLSTGPTSSEGRAKVRLNAVQHGFSGHTVVIAEHERPAYLSHFIGFEAQYKPVGPTEAFLVQSLSDISWSTNQIRTQMTTYMAMLGIKTGIPNTDSGHPEMDNVVAQTTCIGEHIQKLNLLGIYEQRKMRLFAATRKELLQAQAERKAAEQEELELAAAARLQAKSTNTPWLPNENGFVHSVQQIDRFIARRDLLSALSAKKTNARR